MKPEDKSNNKTPHGSSIAPPDNEATLLSDTVLTARLDAGAGQSPRILEVAKDVPNSQRVIKERFVLEELLGSGGMGTVYKARDLRKVEANDREPWVAIKLLNEDFKNHPAALVALQREARKAQTLTHPNIVKVFDFDRDGDVVYLTMEMLYGQDLKHYIGNHPRGVEPNEGIPIIHQLGKALCHAHEKGIVHADFSPKNAFLTESGEVKILDFGIARAIAATDAETANGASTAFDPATLGAMTPGYASFEQLTGQEPHPADDVFALSCTAYQLLTGTHPYGKGTAVGALAQHIRPERISGLSNRQWRALSRGLSLLRDDRQSSATEFLEEFSATSKSALMPVLVAAALVAAIAGVGGYQVYSERRDKRAGEAVLLREQNALEASKELMRREQALKSEQARREHEKINREYLKLAAAMIEENKHDEAQRYLERVQTAAPELAELEELQERLVISRTAYLERMASEANMRAEIDRLAKLSQKHMAAGNLLRPAGNNAYSDYQQILALDPDSLDGRAILQRLIQLHLDGLYNALQRGELDQAAIWLDDLTTIAPNNDNLSRLRADLQRAVALRRQRDSEIQALLSQADAMQGEKTAQRRRDIYLEVLETDALNARAKAGLENAMKDIESARVKARQEAEQDAQALLGHARQLLAESPAQVGKYQKAYEYLLEAQRRNPELDEVSLMIEQMPQQYIQAIEEKIAGNRYDDAERFLKAAIALAPNNRRLAELREELADRVKDQERLVLPSYF